MRILEAGEPTSVFVRTCCGPSQWNVLGSKGATSFLFWILLLQNFLPVINGIRQKRQLWLFEMRFSLKAEEKVQRQR